MLNGKNSIEEWIYDLTYLQVEQKLLIESRKKNQSSWLWGILKVILVLSFVAYTVPTMVILYLLH